MRIAVLSTALGFLVWSLFQLTDEVTVVVFVGTLTLFLLALAVGRAPWLVAFGFDAGTLLARLWPPPSYVPGPRDGKQHPLPVALELAIFLGYPFLPAVAGWLCRRLAASAT